MGKKKENGLFILKMGKSGKNINTKMISWMDVILHIMPKQAFKKQLEIIQMAKCQELGLNIMKMVQENHKEITQMDKKMDCLPNGIQAEVKNLKLIM